MYGQIPSVALKFNPEEKKKKLQFLTLGLKLPHRTLNCVTHLPTEDKRPDPGLHLTSSMYALQYVG